MDGLTLFALFLILWGAATIYVAFFKPKWAWQNGKVQGFVQLLGEKGTTGFFSVVGMAAMVGGILILV